MLVKPGNSVKKNKQIYKRSLTTARVRGEMDKSTGIVTLGISTLRCLGLSGHSFIILLNCALSRRFIRRQRLVFLCAAMSPCRTFLWQCGHSFFILAHSRLVFLFHFAIVHLVIVSVILETLLTIFFLELV